MDQGGDRTARTTRWTAEAIAAYVREVFPELSVRGAPEALTGGYLNHVWRVQARPQSVIVKHAPPHVASMPDVPMSPERLAIEARALEAFGPRLGSLHLPHMLRFDLAESLLIMSDLGETRDLAELFMAWTEERGEESLPGPEDGAILGDALAGLHRDTFDPAHASALARRLRNQDVQETRARVQYDAVRGWLDAARVPDAAALGDAASALGRRFQGPGVCVIMGDLWPRSILLDEHGEWGLIDWEFAHFGHPVQDAAHLDAHLWMLARRAPTSAARRSALAYRAGFLRAYLGATQELRVYLDADRFARDWGVHVGAEVLARAVGPFQGGYLYDGLDAAHPAVCEAVEASTLLMREGLNTPGWAPA